MIYDKIENIDKYAEIPEFAIKFIEGLSENIATGRYELGGENYANIECYTTKSHDICKPEAHKKYIDIQLLLSGHELLQFTGVEGLKISEEYDENRDIMFFKKPEYPLNTVMLVKGVFALLYPNEAHQPQMNFNGVSEQVKKVVVKIRV